MEGWGEGGDIHGRKDTSRTGRRGLAWRNELGVAMMRGFRS